MLARRWIEEHLHEGIDNFARLSRSLVARAEREGVNMSPAEIRVVLDRLISDGRVEPCQWLAEDQRYSPTVYDNKSIHFYWFRMKPETMNTPLRSEAGKRL